VCNLTPEGGSYCAAACGGLWRREEEEYDDLKHGRRSYGVERIGLDVINNR
jgi:hypothetical protein